VIHTQQTRAVVGKREQSHTKRGDQAQQESGYFPHPY
jgi:hypothetical protein